MTPQSGGKWSWEKNGRGLGGSSGGVGFGGGWALSGGWGSGFVSDTSLVDMLDLCSPGAPVVDRMLRAQAIIFWWIPLTGHHNICHIATGFCITT